MVKGMFKKGLVVGIIILLIGVSSQSVFANNISISSFDDDTPPEVEIKFIVVMGWGYAFIANCSDDTGIDRVEFTFDGIIVSICEWEPYEWAIPYEEAKNGIVCAIAYDYAGNNGSDCVNLRSRNLNVESVEDCDCQEVSEIDLDRGKITTCMILFFRWNAYGLLWPLFMSLSVSFRQLGLPLIEKICDNLVNKFYDKYDEIWELAVDYDCFWTTF
jgi:hypothetical protein